MLRKIARKITMKNPLRKSRILNRLAIEEGKKEQTRNDEYTARAAKRALAKREKPLPKDDSLREWKLKHGTVRAKSDLTDRAKALRANMRLKPPKKK